MALREKREEALLLRRQGLPYSAIRKKLSISKSTLSLWLREFPLSREQINVLRATSEIRIEKFRETMLKKKTDRRLEVFEKIKKDFKLNTDPKFFAGFYLYWGEGTKTAQYTVSLTNSDPSLICCYISWLERLGVQRQKLKIKLHLYTDQNEDEIKNFWSTTLNVPLGNFNKSYIKSSLLSDKTYKGMFGYGTCVVTHHNRDVYEYVMAGITYLRMHHSNSSRKV